MRGKWKYIILIALIFYLVMQILLPVMAEKKIKNSIFEQVDSVENLKVEVSSFPAWEILFSRLDRVEVKAVNLSKGQLMVDQIDSRYRDVSIRDDMIIGENTELNIVLSEENLNKYIENMYPELNNFVVKLNPGQIYLSGFVNFFEKRIDFQLTGALLVKERNLITFSPENLSLDEFQVPGELIKSFVKDLGFSIDLSRYNFPIRVEKIKVDSGYINFLGGPAIRKAGL